MRGRQEILASLAWCSWVSTWLAAATHSKGLTLSLAFLLSLFSSHPPHDLLSIFLPLFSPNPNPLTSSLLFLLLLLLLLPFSLPPRHRDPPCCTTTLLSLTSTPPPFPASLPCPSSDCSKKLQNETSSTRWVLMCERLSFFCSRVGLSWRKMILGSDWENNHSSCFVVIPPKNKIWALQWDGSSRDLVLSIAKVEQIGV